jgi:hypothetical protein
MGGVEDDGAAGLPHDGETAHVRNQVVVAEGDASLADQDAVLVDPGFARGRLRLGHHIAHVVGSQELSLLDVDRLAAGGHRRDEVGLAAQECGGLQHVHHRGNRGDLRHFVDVGEHRHTDLAAHIGEDAQSAVHPRAAERLAGTAVGLVERRFIDEGYLQRRAGLLQHPRGVDRKLARFDRARTGDQEERPIEADTKPGDLHQATLRSAWRAERARAASR